jgi:hypothetical protein
VLSDRTGASALGVLLIGTAVLFIAAE